MGRVGWPTDQTSFAPSGKRMRRRDLLLSLSALGLAEGGASPVDAQTAQRVAFLSPESEQANDRIEIFLLEGLRRLGWVEGRI